MGWAGAAVEGKGNFSTHPLSPRTSSTVLTDQSPFSEEKTTGEGELSARASKRSPNEHPPTTTVEPGVTSSNVSRRSLYNPLELGAGTSKSRIDWYPVKDEEGTSRDLSLAKTLPGPLTRPPPPTLVSRQG